MARRCRISTVWHAENGGEMGRSAFGVGLPHPQDAETKPAPLRAADLSGLFFVGKNSLDKACRIR